eukprot:COSAG01_NODE_12401_length_1746_cov_2.282939_2_plen_96_part_00
MYDRSTNETDSTNHAVHWLCTCSNSSPSSAWRAVSILNFVIRTDVAYVNFSQHGPIPRWKRRARRCQPKDWLLILVMHLGVSILKISGQEQGWQR